MTYAWFTRRVECSSALQHGQRCVPVRHMPTPTHKVAGKRLSLDTTVTRMIAAEYAGTEGRNGSATRRSKKPSQRDCMKKCLFEGRCEKVHRCIRRGKSPLRMANIKFFLVDKKSLLTSVASLKTCMSHMEVLNLKAVYIAAHVRAYQHVLHRTL